jgi:electron transfer flavoprotein beta subunit
MQSLTGQGSNAEASWPPFFAQRVSTIFFVKLFTKRSGGVKIAVCIKRVPEMDVKFKIASSGTAIDEAGLKYDMADFDGYAVEAALQMVEKLGAGEVIVISLGPDAVQETLRKALSMGAARAVQLKADSVPFDSFSTASALAAELQGGGYDLILFGRMSTDNANGAVGLMVGELLDLPVIHACSKLEIAGGKGTARRELEGGAEFVSFALPAIVTIDEGIARPRYPSLKGIMAAKKKPLDVRPAQLGDQRLTVVKAELPPERQGGRIVGEGAAAVPELVRLLQTEAKVL